MATRKLVWAGDVEDELVAKVYKGGWSTLVLSSEGGDLYACRAIVDYLTKHEKPILVTGKCFSCATAIAVAASKCEATPGTRFMVHRPHIMGLNGESDVIAREKHELDTWLKWYLDLLVRRTHTPKETWEDLVQDETYLSSRAALDIGLVDSIHE